MASSDVFQDIHAKEIYLGKNSSITSMGSLFINEAGTGDPAIVFGTAGTRRVFLGIDNSNSDVFNISYNSPGLTTNGEFIINSAKEISVGGQPVADAQFTIVSNAKSFMPPRMTSVQMEGMATLSGGMVYNTTSGGLFLFVSSGTWHRIGTSAN